MSGSSAVFRSAAEHATWLASVSALPRGFRVGATSLTFRPVELPTREARMGLTLIALDAPTASWGAMFTRNAFPGAPVAAGRARLAAGGPLQALLINSKVSNVAAPGGGADAEALCTAAAAALGLPGGGAAVLPSSTGVIGWRLPTAAMAAALPAAVAALQRESILPAARGIMTTDGWPKVRRAPAGALGGGAAGGGATLVGIAKGAGMIEPNLATMLVYLLTDVALPPAALRASLAAAVEGSFNALSIDSDTSTSDTVVLVSSGAVPLAAAGGQAAFDAALARVCAELAEDVVRNGEGVQHVMRVAVRGAPSAALARAVGKAVVNSPLFKCAVGGNDPNVGRLVAAVGKCVGALPGAPLDVSRVAMRMGGIDIFARGAFTLSPDTERALVAHMRAAQLWESAPVLAPGAAGVPAPDGRAGTAYAAQDVSYVAPIAYPPHERSVEIEIDLGLGEYAATALGSDLTHEYVTENADYRS